MFTLAALGRRLDRSSLSQLWGAELTLAALLHCKFTAAVAEKTRLTSELPPMLSGKLCILCESRVQYGTVQGE